MEDHLDEQRLRRLIEVGRSLLSQLDPEAVLDQVLETAREITGARYAALGILDRDRRELERFITRGIDTETHRSIGDLPRGRGILGVLIDTPRPLRLAVSCRSAPVRRARRCARCWRCQRSTRPWSRAYRTRSAREERRSFCWMCAR
jgi:GAF domain-containing protein